MRSLWMTVLFMASALVAPRLPLASDTSYDRKLAERGQEPSGAGSGETTDGMRGKHEGMHGMHGGMMGGMECCGGMASYDVTVEDTPEGAVLRFEAKEPGDVSRVRRMAHMMESCMEAGSGAGEPSSDERTSRGSLRETQDEFLREVWTRP